MKARLSPLDLHSYFVIDVGCTANPAYQPDKPVLLELEDQIVETALATPGSEGNDEKDAYRVVLHIRQKAPPEKNAPYNFHIVLHGWFGVHPGVPADTCAQLVETTGGSILFGVAREILRNLMATGPYLPILLPSVSFHPNAPELKAPAPEIALPVPKKKKLTRKSKT